jgi:formate dehydrogenase major subunit
MLVGPRPIPEGAAMSDPTPRPHRRDFLRRSATGGFALGGVLGLGADLRAAHHEVKSRFKFANVREVPSVCPYCAVGCSQLVAVRDGQIVNIEGNPDSPINRGTLCPKGAAAYQLVVNPHRITKVLYRAPGATEWEVKPRRWAMDRVAQLVKQTRDATFRETIRVKDETGQEVERRCNHTLAIGSLGGATLDNEWNYLQAKLMRALGVVSIENQARI